MAKQMCWLDVPNYNRKVLHIRLFESEVFRPYTNYSEYIQPDSLIPGVSKGYRTAQMLLSLGWELIPSEIGEGLSAYESAAI